ncbi:MAG: O-antigen ligase family protein [Nitrospinae bacterium]|nr:O-antigen ligase family protein [Nitrospinota bacterium]
MAEPSIDPTGRWDTACWAFTALFCVADFISISVAQMAATGMGVCFLGRWINTGQRPNLPPVLWPVALFVGVSIVAALFSLDAMESIVDSKDLLHLFILFAVYDYFVRRPGKAVLALKIMAGAGGAVSVYGLAQAMGRGVDIYNRISGFQDIYMTFAGLLMMAVMAGGAVILFHRGGLKDGWIAMAVAIMISAVFVSLTRNAVVGLFAGAVALLALKNRWTVAALPVVALVALTLSPSHVRDRVVSIADMSNETNRERFNLWAAGLEIIRDNPVLGVGQNSFPLVYPAYRRPDVKEPNISHLHNNFIQIGAERGLAGLGAWISVWAVALWKMGSAFRMTSDTGMKTSLAAGGAGVLAFLSAGMFEYNFGDAEIQMLFYLFMAMGLAAAKPAEDAIKGPTG